MSTDKDTALRLESLRQELKQWEKAFAAANKGRKAARQDIKRDATIAAIYHEYNNLRERPANTDGATPKRVSKHAQSLESVAEEEDEKRQQVEITPAFIRHALGPTPQKDGLLLGIFDLPSSATPSKPSVAPSGPIMPFVSGTPSRPTALVSCSDQTLSRTPQSSSKRFFFDAFAGTPLKRKREDDGHSPAAAKRHYATPSFLRRSFPIAKLDEQAVADAPAFNKRGLVRSLSSIIQGLRKQEDKRMDDEWDVLNELEQDGQEDEGTCGVAKELVEDSQAQEMPLGPDQADRGSENGSSGPEDVDLNGQSRKPWKKKGLKRQTKRVIMRPIMHKAKKADRQLPLDEAGTEAGAVVRTSKTRDATDRAAGDDDEGSDDTVDEDAPTCSKAKAEVEKKAAEPRPRKKISAQSHANYRALKIKNKNSKAKGKGGRFGRR